MDWQGVACPHCGSHDIAQIQYGLPILDDELESELASDKVVLGECVVSRYDPEWYCNACNLELGAKHDAYLKWIDNRGKVLRSIVYGAAIGDALGVPYESMKRDSFICEGMASGGVHGMPTGTFSDDTSLMLATCDSIKKCNRYDIEDMRTRFKAWRYQGSYTADGKVFDVGNTTAKALEQGYGCKDEYSNGNGSLMRIAPLAVPNTTPSIVRDISGITHAHKLSTKSCFFFLCVLRDASMGFPLKEVIEGYVADFPEFGFLQDLAEKPRDEIRSGGYVIDTLTASLWCALKTHNYKDCVLEAVNLGDDSDTTGCVAGALAGAMYGYESIPSQWINQLRGKEIIEECLFF